MSPSTWLLLPDRQGYWYQAVRSPDRQWSTHMVRVLGTPGAYTAQRFGNHPPAPPQTGADVRWLPIPAPPSPDTATLEDAWFEARAGARELLGADARVRVTDCGGSYVAVAFRLVAVGSGAGHEEVSGCGATAEGALRDLAARVAARLAP